MSTDGKKVDGRTMRYRDRRPKLLDAVTEYVLDHGAAELSLRPVAVAVGVTHATLLRHFSTKEGLIAAVAQHIRESFEHDLTTDPQLTAAESSTELARAVWRKLCNPQQRRQFALLFELASSRNRNTVDPHQLSESMVGKWVAMIAEQLQADGWTEDQAILRATLFLAQIRGMQLDLLLTNDQLRLDAAFEISLEQLHH
jgi:AcrR family transcriptional regulator